MVGNSKRRRQSGKAGYWSSVVLDPAHQPESTVSFIARVTNQFDDKCLQLPAVDHYQKRKSPNNCFLVRHKELTRKRQQTLNICGQSSRRKTEGDCSRQFLVTVGNNFMATADPVRQTRQQLPTLTKEPSAQLTETPSFPVEQTIRVSRLRIEKYPLKSQTTIADKVFTLTRRISQVGRSKSREKPLLEYIRDMNISRPRFSSVDPTGCSPWNINSDGETERQRSS